MVRDRSGIGHGLLVEVVHCGADPILEFLFGPVTAKLCVLAKLEKATKIQSFGNFVGERPPCSSSHFVEGNARRRAPQRSGEHHWAGALRPDRVEQDVEAVDLDQEADVTDERNAATFLVDHSRRRPVRYRGRQDVRPPNGTGPPHEHVDKATVLVRATRIEEARAVEVVADRPLVVGVSLRRRALGQDTRDKSGETGDHGTARGHNADHQDATTASLPCGWAATASVPARCMAASPSFIVIRGA